MNKDSIACRLHNDSVDFNLVLDKLSAETLTEIFLHEEGLKCFDKYVEVPKTYIQWITEDAEILDIFKSLSKYLQVTPEYLIRIFFFFIIKEDKFAFKTFIKKQINNKKDFLKTFRKYNARYLASKETKNLISPDILICFYCYVYMNRFQKNDIEVPVDVLPYILNIEGVIPDLENTPPGFDPNMPYESDVYDINNATKKSFLERFHLKK